MNNILILPSVNIEVYISSNRELGNGYAKVPIDDYKFTIGGSSLNIAIALRSAGYNPTLFAFVGDGDDGVKELLLYHLHKLNITHNVFDVLGKNNVAFIDRCENYHDIIKGHKSYFHNGKDLISEMNAIKDQYDFKIASGIDEKEVPVTEVLFTKQGTNLLVPKKALLEKCGSDIKSILPNTNIMCIDMNEYKASGAKSLSDFGFELVTVTDEDKEGAFCFHGQEGFFQPERHPKGTKIFQTGAGDWFAGALTAFLDRGGMSVKDSSLSIDMISSVVKKAASISTQKVLYQEAILGPKY